MFVDEQRYRASAGHRPPAPRCALTPARGLRTAGGSGGRIAAEDTPGYHSAPAPRSTRAQEATARLQRCITSPGSPLGAALARLVDAVEELAACDVDAEHPDILGDAVVALGHLQTRAHARLLDVIESFDRREGFAADGAATAWSWLAARTGSDHSAAANLVQSARRLHRLPRLAAHLAAGDITPAHATAVTAAAVPHRAEAIAGAEAILADLALAAPPRDLRCALRRLADAADPDGADASDQRTGGDPLRELTLRGGYQGRGELLGTLDPLTREALSVLLDAFDTPGPADTPGTRSFAQRRHDAFAAMLHTLLAQPGLPTVQGARPQILLTIDLAALLGLSPDHPAADLTLADVVALLGIDPTALGLAPAQPAMDTAVSADPAADDTAETGTPAADDTAQTGTPTPPAPSSPSPAPWPARFGSGVTVPPALVRGLLPAATIMAVLTLGPWRAVNVGSKHRTLPAWLRTVLAAMHQHCRGPDCDRFATWTQAHHITPWATGRTTDLNDTLPLCPYHHKLIDKGWTATLDHATGEVTWTSPQGRIFVVPPAGREPRLRSG